MIRSHHEFLHYYLFIFIQELSTGFKEGDKMYQITSDCSQCVLTNTAQTGIDNKYSNCTRMN